MWLQRFFESRSLTRVGANATCSASQERTLHALLVSPFVFTSVLSGATITSTVWLTTKFEAEPKAPASPWLLVGLLFYLLVLVAVLRLSCLAGMLLSASRRDEAVKILPGVTLFRELSGASSQLPASRCKRRGALVLIEAALLFTIWGVCLLVLCRQSA